MKPRSDWNTRLAAFALSLFLPLLASSCQIDNSTLAVTLSSGLIATTATKSPSGIPTLNNHLTLTPAPSAGGPQIGKVGERVLSAGVAITVLDVTQVPRASFFLTGQESTYIDVEIIVENADFDGALPYNPYYFKVVDENGNISNAALSSIDVSLKTGDLARGEMVRGHIDFEVRSSAARLVLSFEPNIFIAGYQPVRINLNQKSAQTITAPTPQPLPNEGNANQRIISNDMALMVTNVSFPQTIGIYQPAQGRIFLDVEVMVENIGTEGNLSYNPLDFILKDSEGFEYTTALIALQPNLSSGDLGPGKTVQGHITFEVREKASGFTLSFQPLALFKHLGVIVINLGE